MKIFILESVENLTPRYHSDGGLVVVARDIEAAKRYVKERAQRDLYSGGVFPVVTDEEWAAAVSFNVSATEPRMWVFQDAGCC